MFPQIARALTRGYTTKQIIDMILKRFPNQSAKIKEALAAGYTVDQIVKYLGGGKEEVANMDPQTDTGVNTEYVKTRQADKNNEQKVNQTAMQGSLAALGGIGAGMAAKAYQHALPSNLLGYGQNTPPGPQPNLPAPPTPMGPGPNSPGVQVLTTNQSPSPAPEGPKIPPGQTGQAGSFPQQNINPLSSQPPVKGNSLAQNPNLPQPINTQRDIKKSVDILKNLGQDGAVKNMLEGGMNHKDIAGVLKTIMPKDRYKTLEAQEGGIEQIVSDFAESMQQPEEPNAKAEPIQSQELEETQPTSQKLDEIQPEAERAEEKRKPIEKGGVVATPQGVGEVKEIRNGKAIVDVDGKKHQVDEEDLEEEPKEVIEEVQKLLKIPEVDRSSIVSLFTFDPDEKKMYIQFHNGETYKYLDVDPEKVMKIANKMGIPITKGKNIFGAWSPEDKKSLGATLIKEIINDPKYKKTKKGEEPNPNYIQLETLYDYWEKLRQKPKKKK
jgi:KTSC domain-containing protein